MRDKFLKFLAKSPLGTATKVGIGAALAYVIDNIASFNLNPSISVALIALVTMAINWLNPHDSRYGVNKAS
jgi:hypothetical protein